MLKRLSDKNIVELEGHIMQLEGSQNGSSPVLAMKDGKKKDEVVSVLEKIE